MSADQFCFSVDTEPFQVQTKDTVRPTLSYDQFYELANSYEFIQSHSYDFTICPDPSDR